MDAEAPKLPTVGEIVGGKYRVERVLGRGGMGTVLAVRHLGLDEPRALKLMLPRGMELPQARERFFREARAAAKLRSEHAVSVHDVGVLPDGFPYIEMELLEGTDLSALLKKVSAVPVSSAVEWIAQACEPVGEAHALGIVHRDLKPGNLFLTKGAGGREIIKVLDFGIAKTASADTDPSLTGTNASFGSPMYMSPEQMRGARFADPRSDLWALGVVLFELMTGRRPFMSDSITALALIVTSEPAPHPMSLRPDVPPVIDAIVMRCLAKAPEDRWSSAAELAAALRGALGLPAPRASLPSLGGGPPVAAMAAPRVLGPAIATPIPPPVATPAPAPGAPPSPISAPSLPLAPHAGLGAPAPPLLAPGLAPQGAAPDALAPGSAATPSMAPSQPSVGTLSTTIGVRRGPSPGVLIGGASAAVVVGVTIAVLAWRATSGPAPASSQAPLGPSAEAPLAAPAPPPEPRSERAGDGAPEAAPPAVEPSSAGDDGAAPAEAKPPPGDAPEGEASARPSASSPRAPGSAKAGAPAGSGKPGGGKPGPKPKSGFGGID